MDELLQKRLGNRLGKQASNFVTGITGQTKGAISDREMNMFKQASPSISSPTDFAMDITGQTKGAISNAEMQLLEQAQMEAGETFTPEEKELVLAQIRKLEKQSQAPNFPLTQQLASMGTGDDTVIAHLEPGEVVLAKEFMEDPEFESVVESKFREFGIDPAQAIVDDPRGIISLDTGAQQFGFFKKVGKFLKKVVTPVAKVAQFIPGPWQAPAALISKAATVRDVARGDASPLALATVVGPTALGGSVGENIAGIKAAGDGSFLKGLGSLGGKTLSGIGKAVTNPMEAIRGIPSLMGRATMSGQPRVQENLQTNAEIAELERQAMEANSRQDYGKEAEIYAQINQMKNQATMPTSEGGFGGIFSGGGADNVGNYGVVGDVLGGLTDQMGITNYGGQQGQQGQPSLVDRLTGTGGGIGGLGDLAKIGVTGGLAGALAKLAYDETKKDKGVALTPLTQMDATGRYNIEAEIARRTGQPAPNPVEFGLLPAGTFPTLSGGQPMQANEGGVAQKQYPNKGLEALAKVAPQVVDRMGYYGGGMVMPMAYAEGGNVDMNEFERMNGRIDGQGTETSDDIPAMLSDGEFVMTGQAVRGAGSFEMQKGAGGIISLVPSLSESRERGIDLMYKMMDAFAGKAQPSQEPA